MGDCRLSHKEGQAHRQIPEAVKTTVLTLYAKQYGDFGPTLAAEKLAERHAIAVL
ncbi:MAG: hypothetical protein HXY51_15085 [Nitrospirae bacterium]|nr:hypothetical protein [Nitrospirota bacterium]